MLRFDRGSLTESSGWRTGRYRVFERTVVEVVVGAIELDEDEDEEDPEELTEDEDDELVESALLLEDEDVLAVLEELGVLTEAD